MITVYIIYSSSTGRYYAGFTHELASRLKKHRRKQNRSTCFASDWMPVWTQEVPDNVQARALEKRIKTRGIGRFLNDHNVSTF